MRVASALFAALALLVLRAGSGDPVAGATQAVAQGPVSEELSALPRSEVFLCPKCGAVIARGVHYMGGTPEARFLTASIAEPALGSAGTVLRFANPMTNDEHDVVRFAEAEGAVSDGDPQTAVSYFPGYSWSVLRCAECAHSLGWRFDRLVSGRVDPSIAAAAQRVNAATETAARAAQLASTRAAAERRIMTAMQHSPAAEEAAIAPLRGSCAELTQGFWTYEVCHEREVTQFHVPPELAVSAKQSSSADGDGGGSTPRDIRKPSWSLGTRSAKPRRRRESTNPKYFASHFFDGGQHCDETGKGRQTEVQYLCCNGVHNAIIAVDEPDVCSYKVQLCIRGACEKLPAAELEHRAASSGSESSPDSGSTTGDGAGSGGGRREGEPASVAEIQLGSRGAEAEPVVEPQSGGAGSQATAPPEAATTGPARFFGLLWPALVGDESEALAWVKHVDVFTGFS